MDFAARTKAIGISRSSLRCQFGAVQSFLFVCIRPESAERLEMLTKEKERNEAIVFVVGREERRPIADRNPFVFSSERFICSFDAKRDLAIEIAGRFHHLQGQIAPNG